jgi:hypothetical protein
MLLGVADGFDRDQDGIIKFCCPDFLADRLSLDFFDVIGVRLLGGIFDRVVQDGDKSGQMIIGWHVVHDIHDVAEVGPAVGKISDLLTMDISRNGKRVVYLFFLKRDTHAIMLP